MNNHRLLSRVRSSMPRTGIPCIISLQMPAEHPAVGCAMRRMLEIESVVENPVQGKKIPVPGLKMMLPVASATWEPRKGVHKQILTIDLAPSGTRIPINEEELKNEHGYQEVTN